MQTRVVTPPARPLTLDEVKLDLYVDHSDDDALIGALIDAATAHLGGPEGWTGIAIGQQTLEVTGSSFGCLSDHEPLLLPYWPIAEPLSVEYLDVDGVVQTFDPAGYELYLDRGVILAPDVSLPTLARRPDAVRVCYLAGAAVLDPAVRQAMLLLIGHWYQTREAVNVGNIVSELPFSVDALLLTIRRFP